ncbi:hypothetical protein, partial [Alistipes putredinis]|uniref:hypothetical protein n=1 Tax=Alistipes putredinis TaxID=28117 RepID=UPI003AB3BEC8
ESISEIICLSLTIAFSIESFLIALKDTHFLRNTELKAILFYLRNLNQIEHNGLVRRFGDRRAGSDPFVLVAAREKGRCECKDKHYMM